MLRNMLLLTVLFVAGCSGTVYTVKNPQFDEGVTEGVLFYGYKEVEKATILDRIRHPKTGEITHSAYEPSDSTGYCQPQKKLVKVIEPDFDTMYAVKYDSALFETSKFSVELEKGMLKSVNSESTPGPKTAVEALQGLVDVRSSILKGVEDAGDAESQKMLSNIRGELPQRTPITCTASE